MSKFIQPRLKKTSTSSNEMKRLFEEQLKESLSEIEKLKSQNTMSQNEYQKQLDLVNSKFERGMDIIEKRSKDKKKCTIS